MNAPDVPHTTSRADLVVIFLIVGVSIFFIAGNFLKQAAGASGPRRALVYHDKELLKTLDLGRDGTVSVLNGRMTIEVREGRVRVLEADCPQHVCVLAGWKKAAGETIVCVPNRLLIEIKADKPSMIDAVAY